MIVIRPKERYSATALDTRTRGPQLKRYHEDCIKIAKILDTNGLKTPTGIDGLPKPIYNQKFNFNNDTIGNYQDKLNVGCD